MSILANQAQSVRPHVPASQPPPWPEALRNAVRDADELCRLLQLPSAQAAEIRKAADGFPLFVTREYLARVRRGDGHDPLLRQVLPVSDELIAVPGDLQDPVGDGAALLSPGVLRKYHGRALLVTTGACAVHCRYCFRRHFPYETAPRGLAAWDRALAAIEADPACREVILSGGDPLTLVDSTLAALAERIALIPQVQRLRVHTRLPIVLPQRVTGELIAWLRSTRLTPWVVVHANHPRELDDAVAAALARLVDAGIPVLNQAVLLRGVNDELRALVELCERLTALRVVPYYLHHLDRVAGAAHFAVPIEEGRLLVAGLRERLPGYAVPQYVEERAGAEYKLALA
ncbi:MAG: EF-P beta-lysylation protein EpmB [Pirellulales bacterium]|nr:EF-P beta-lysylation protein EpmB [Pirellulales bacterium]